MRGVRNPEQEAIVIREYPNKTALEIEREFGISHTQVSVIARRHGLSHSKEKIEQIRQFRRSNVRRAHDTVPSDELSRRISQGIVKARRRHRMRLDAGLPSPYKFIESERCYKTTKIIGNLCHRFHYIPTDDPFTLFYDEHTIRPHMRPKAIKTESDYTAKYGIIFQADYIHDHATD